LVVLALLVGPALLHEAERPAHVLLLRLDRGGELLRRLGLRLGAGRGRGVAVGAAIERFQSLISRNPPEASHAPSGLNATELTRSRWAATGLVDWAASDNHPRTTPSTGSNNMRRLPRPAAAT
jgi:hypothetical protein